MALFNWEQSEEETAIANPVRKTVLRPAPKNYTEDLVANTVLTKGLYHNSYPGLRLAGAMAFAPIAVPVWFMGMPIAKPDDENNEALKELLTRITLEMSGEFEKIHTCCHREGTIWIWPMYDSRNMRLHWEFIEDDSVVDIIKDMVTGEPVVIITENQIQLKTGREETGFVIMRRTFTKEKITVQYMEKSGSISMTLMDKTQRNVIGILPIAFANNTEPNKIRGFSDYERLLPDLKNYHDIELQSSQILVKFNVKMVQNTNNYETYKKNLFEVNGIGGWDEFDPATTDFIINEGEDQTTFIWPEGAYEAAEAKLKRIFKKIIEANGVPEIVWGLKTEGNRASVEESMSGLVRYVQNKQDQKTDEYKKLFEASIKLLSIAEGINVDSALSVSWDDMDGVSEEVKSIIFQNYSDGLSKLIPVSGMTKTQLYNLYKMHFPKITTEDFEQFNIGIMDMIQNNQFKTIAYEEARDYSQQDTE